MNDDVEKLLATADRAEDLVASCGGVLAEAVSRGAIVRVALCGDGDAGAGGEGLASARPAPESLRRLGVSEVFHLPGRGHAAEWADALVRILEPWSPDRVLCPVHAENQPFVRAVRVAMSRAGGEAALDAAELCDPLPVDRTIDVASVAERKASALEALGARGEDAARLDRAARLGALRGERVESFRRLARRDRESDLLWRWIAGIGPSVRSTEPPIVSVVVRTRNRLDLLAEALESLRAQTLRALEVVLVNDGGEDVSSVVRGVRDLDVRIVDSPGVGRAAAANLGIEAARGRYLAFLDDDDRFLPGHLETLVGFLEANGEFAGAYDDVEVAELESVPGEARRSVRRRHVPYAQDFDRDLLLFGNYVPIIALVLRREAAEAAGPFRDDLDILEDWDFLVRLTRKHVLRRVPGIGAEYRVRLDGGNQTRVHPWGSLEESLARVDIVRRHFDQLTPEAVVRGYRILMERSFVADGELQLAKREIEALRRRIDALGEEADARVRDAAARRSGEDAEAIRRLEAECELLSTELVRRGETLQAQAGALHRLGAEIERLSGAALGSTREVGGLHREIERREELIRAMRATRIWRIRDWMRGLARRPA